MRKSNNWEEDFEMFQKGKEAFLKLSKEREGIIQQVNNAPEGKEKEELLEKRKILEDKLNFLNHRIQRR